MIKPITILCLTFGYLSLHGEPPVQSNESTPPSYLPLPPPTIAAPSLSEDTERPYVWGRSTHNGIQVDSLLPRIYITTDSMSLSATAEPPYLDYAVTLVLLGNLPRINIEEADAYIPALKAILSKFLEWNSLAEETGVAVDFRKAIPIPPEYHTANGGKFSSAEFILTRSGKATCTIGGHAIHISNIPPDRAKSALADIERLPELEKLMNSEISRMRAEAKKLDQLFQ